MTNSHDDETWLLSELTNALQGDAWVPIEALERVWLSQKTDDLGDFAEVLFALSKQGRVRIDNSGTPIKIFPAET